MSTTFRIAHSGARHRYVMPTIALAITLPLFPLTTASAAQSAPSPEADSQVASILPADVVCDAINGTPWALERLGKQALKNKANNAMKDAVLAWNFGRTPANIAGKIASLGVGAGATILLSHAKESCPPGTLNHAVEAIPFLTAEPKEPATTPSKQTIEELFVEPRDVVGEAQAAVRAAGVFNQSGSVGMTPTSMRNLADTFCKEYTQWGTPKSDIGSFIGRADLRALPAISDVTSLALKRCPNLSSENVDDLTWRLNQTLIVNQSLKETPPQITNTTWYCGATSQQITLEWQTFAPNGVARYELWARVNGIWYEVPISVTVNQATARAPINNIAREASYEFLLQAVDQQGNSSAWSSLSPNLRACPA